MIVRYSRTGHVIRCCGQRSFANNRKSDKTRATLTLGDRRPPSDASKPSKGIFFSIPTSARSTHAAKQLAASIV